MSCDDDRFNPPARGRIHAGFTITAPDFIKCRILSDLKSNPPTCPMTGTMADKIVFNTTESNEPTHVSISFPPPVPSIPDLIARWRKTFAPADRKALWKALNRDMDGIHGGYMHEGVCYRAAVVPFPERPNYAIEVS